MNQILEARTICCNKIKAMRSIVVSDKLLKCKNNCNEEYQKQCPDYKPLGMTQEPFTKGINAYVLMRWEL